MKLALTPVVAATLFVSTNAFSSYLDNFAGGSVQKYTPPPPKVVADQGGYLSNMAGAAPATPAYPAAAPVAAAAPADSGSYMDTIGGGGVQKYTPPAPKVVPDQGGYLSNMAGTAPAAPAAAAPVAAAPVAAADSGSYMETIGGGGVQKYTPPAPKVVPDQGGYLSNMSGAAPAAAAPEPVAAAPVAVPVAAAPVAAASTGTYMDSIGGGGVQKYTPPAPKVVPDQGGYLSNMSSAAPAAAAPAPVAAAPVAAPLTVTAASTPASVSADGVVHHHTHDHHHKHEHHHHHTHNHTH